MPLPEHHRLAAVDQDAVFGVPDHRAREHRAFDVAAHCGELGRVHRMVGACDVLLDDRALVESAGDVMRGGADQLDAAVEGLLVGVGTLEAGQERMVDVDGPAFERLAGAVGQSCM